MCQGNNHWNQISFSYDPDRCFYVTLRYLGPDGLPVCSESVEGLDVAVSKVSREGNTLEYGNICAVNKMLR